MAKKQTTPTKVESIRHKDKRANIPTEEQFDREGRPIHTVWGISKGHNRSAALVTAYRPDPSRWQAGFMERRK